MTYFTQAFLFSSALVLRSCNAAGAASSKQRTTVPYCNFFVRPPSNLLPPSADAFLTLVFGVKLKDDDMRKQRVKMEAQVKRQTQVPRAASSSGMGMISLPRA